MKKQTSAPMFRIRMFFLVLLTFGMPRFGKPDFLRQASVSKDTGQLLQGSAIEKTVLEDEYRITFEGVTMGQEGESTWQYLVEELPDSKDLSYWVLELPDCAPVLTASPNPWRGVYPDPSTHLYGIRWDVEEEFRSGHFKVTVQGQWSVGTTRLAAKGKGILYGEISGPDCTEQSSPQAKDDYVSTQQGTPVTIDVMSNDTDPDGDVLSLLSFQTPSESGGIIERVDNGTAGDASDDSLQYSPPAGFIGEDRFVYSVSDGNHTAQASVIVTVQQPSPTPDQTAPTIAWVSPTSEKGRYDVEESQTVVLEVNAFDDRAVARVVFQRWDAVNEKYVLVANITAAPYRVELSATELNPEWNQVYVVAIDTAGNQSDYQYIWLYKLIPGGTIGSEIKLYFPLIQKK